MGDEAMADYVMTLRALSNGAFGETPGPTVYLKLQDTDQAPFPPQRAIDADDWVRDILQTVPKKRDGTGASRGDVLVFIHGYNNAMDAVLERHRLLKKNLAHYGFAGTVISFDWPCDDVALAYLADRQQAKQTAYALVTDGIKRVAKMQAMLDCDINVHLLAHSTGAYVVREAFDDADEHRDINGIGWTVSQIAFISGDISAGSMASGNPETESIYGHCLRLTNYSNGHDDVLQLSNVKRVGFSPRVGRVGLPDSAPAVGLNVDCSAYYDAYYAGRGGLIAGITLSHGWQFDDMVFAFDLAQTLKGDSDRGVISTRATAAPNRYVLRWPPP